MSDTFIYEHPFQIATNNLFFFPIITTIVWTSTISTHVIHTLKSICIQLCTWSTRSYKLFCQWKFLHNMVWHVYNLGTYCLHVTIRNITIIKYSQFNAKTFHHDNVIYHPVLLGTIDDTFLFHILFVPLPTNFSLHF